jgi:murein DD-endopeptidase MepM/ murein hydrolase activator NlpD
MRTKPAQPRRCTSQVLVLALGLASASVSANAPPSAAAAVTLPAAPAPAQPTQRMAALEVPVDDPRITSPYGWRLHPILKRRRFHKGVDYGAPQGTPVHAAEDGVVESMGRRSHYGLYLRIRHCRTVETAYAHLAGFAPGLHVGSVVSRGEVVASVGRTGWATGPHLYYEVIVDGRRVNPDKPGLLVPVDVTPAPQTQQTAQNGTS